MAEMIEYSSEIIMDTMKQEILEKLGEPNWNMLVNGIGAPSIEAEPKCQCRTMREFLRRFDDITDSETAKSILTNVRHGLKHSQFGWAKDKFLKYKNLDVFINALLEEAVVQFAHLCDTGEPFYGQPITREVLDFLLANPNILVPERKGKALYITAFPYDMVHYLRETDARRKRYFACHCPFARESILCEGACVSRTMCYCSLGHAKIMWDVIFDMDLEGDVVESALNGDTRCRYVIYLPDEVINKYT